MRERKTFMRKATAFTTTLALCLMFLGIAPVQAAGPLHSARHAPIIKVKNSTSINWSGYANTGTTFKVVKGSWTQPSVTCGASETSYSSFWVGIDGDTTNTVEQTGTDSDCSSGTPTYY